MGLDLAASRTSWLTDTGSQPAAVAAPQEPAAGVQAAAPARAAHRHPWHVRAARLCGPASLGLVLLGPLLGYLAYHAAASDERDALRAAVSENLGERSRRISEEVLALAEVVHSCRGYFDASVLVERHEFATFTRQARARHASLLSVGWAPRIPAALRAQHEREMRDEGFTDYQIWERGPERARESARPRPEYYPYLFAEPMEGNERVLGSDLASEPARARAIEAALARDEVVLSDPVTLVQAPSWGRGALLLRAVRRPSTASGPGELLGVVLVAFRFSDLVEGVLARAPDAADPLLALELSGTTVEGKPVRLYAGDPRRLPADAEEFSATRSLPLAGQVWHLRGVPTQRLLSAHRHGESWLVGAAVFTGWELFAGFLMALAVAARSQALRRQARSVQLVLRSLGEGVVVTDRDGVVQLVNSAAGHILHENPGELGSLADVARCGFTGADGTTPCSAEHLPLTRALAGLAVEPQEFRIRPIPGESGIWVSATARPLLDESGVQQGAVMVLRDVTARKQSEESIRRLSSAVEQAADAVFITDCTGAIQYVNPAFERISGWTSAEVVGRTPRLLKSDRHDAATYERIWATVLRGEVYRGTLTNRRKDGQHWVTAQTITPMKDTAGRVTHFVAVCQDMTERMRLQDKEVEMRLAAKVQRRLYPHDLGPVPGLDLAGTVLPALETCGDYYDGMTLPCGAFALAVGDVSGKGLGPALVMAETRAYVRSLADAGLDPAEILARVNLRLSQDLADELFVTLLLVTLDPVTRRVTYANAGHPAGLLLAADGTLKTRLAATGTPLGMFEGSRYGAVMTPPLEADDCLVLVTDGATECPGAEEEMFDEEGVLETVRAHRGESAQAIVDHLLAALRRFGSGRPLRDDVTIVVVKGTAVPAPPRRESAAGDAGAAAVADARVCGPAT